MLRGNLAAAITPLREDGAMLDGDVFAPYVDFLVEGGLDGILALGTTGEGILLSTEERKRAAELFLAAAARRFQVAVHCGAQTTAATVALTRHAVEAGADAVAVIGPTYFAYDEEALYRHFAAAAEAAGPFPFYLYEFKARTGYSIPLSVIERLGDRVAGLKVSNQPWEAVEPYLLGGWTSSLAPRASSPVASNAARQEACPLSQRHFPRAVPKSALRSSASRSIRR